MTPDRNRKNLFKSKDSFSLDVYMTAGSCALIISASCGQIGLVNYALAAIWLIFCGVIIVYANKSLGATESYIRRFLRNYGKTGLLGIVFGSCLLTSLFFALAEPSQALFLLDTESKLTALFTTASTANTGVINALKTIFVGLRGLLIIAVAYGGFKIFQARDDQDDMKTAARMPVMLLVVSTIVDVMAGVIAT